MPVTKPAFGSRPEPLFPILMLMVIGLASCAAPPVPPPKTLPPQPSPKTIQTRLPTIQYTIQVGAFSSIERAARYADRLQAAGLDAYYFVDEDKLCKVRFEKFETKAAAAARASALQAQGLIDDFYIIQPAAYTETADERAALRSSIVTTAHRFIGTPYCWGGTSAQSGFDCSGLTMTVYRLNGMELPRIALDQYRTGTPVALEALQNGDLIFFSIEPAKDVSHVGIYTGQDRFIHAPGRGKHIRTASLSNSYFRKRYRGARRYFE